MAKYCDDCGTKYSNGVCPNCNELEHEEIHNRVFFEDVDIHIQNHKFEHGSGDD